MQLITLVILAILVGFILPVAIILGIVVLFCYRAAKNQQQATFVPEGTMQFVVAGDIAAGGTCIRILENVPKFYYEEGGIDWHGNPTTFMAKVGELIPAVTGLPEHWEVRERAVKVVDAVLPGDPTYPAPLGKKIRHYLRSRWGFFWVSFAYPERHIHRFKVPKVRLREGYKAGQELSEWVERDPEPTEVSELQWQFPRPIPIPEVIFQDNFRADLGVVVMFQVVQPRIPVFKLRGNFFPLLESTIAGVVRDWARKRDYNEFIREIKVGPTSDFFAQVISQANITAPDMAAGIIDGIGVAAVNAWVDAIKSHEDEETQKALRALELATLKGKANIKTATLGAQAAVKKAKGEAKAIEEVGKAEAAVLKQKARGAGVALAVAEQRVKEVAGFTGSVYAPGTGGVIVSAPAEPRKLPPAETDSETEEPTTPP